MLRFKPERNIKREKFIKRTIIISTILIVLIVSFLVKRHLDNKFIPVTYEVCGLTQEEIVDKYSHVYTDNKEILDYFVYGETMSLFFDKYDISSLDKIIGNTLLVRNTCDNTHEYIKTATGQVDGQLPIETFEDGMYELYVNENLQEKRLFVAEKMEIVTYSVRRNGTMKKATLFADKNIFDDRENSDVQDKHYLFLKIETVHDIETEYDFIINPAYSDRDNGYYTNYGIQYGYNESEYNYNLAVELQKSLEALGYKVLISREMSEVVNTYGVDGRLYRGYMANAKYLIDLRLDSSYNRDFTGLSVNYSSFSSLKMASSISSYLKYNTDLEFDTTVNQGVFAFSRSQGFESNMNIREAGGKALNAANYSELSKENQSFAENNIRGMQGLSIRLGYISNIEFMDKLGSNYSYYGEKIAEAIHNYLSFD